MTWDIDMVGAGFHPRPQLPPPPVGPSARKIHYCVWRKNPSGPDRDRGARSAEGNARANGSGRRFQLGVNETGRRQAFDVHNDKRLTGLASGLRHLAAVSG